jgi:hypothetical protein
VFKKAGCDSPHQVLNGVVNHTTVCKGVLKHTLRRCLA